MDMRASNEKEM